MVVVQKLSRPSTLVFRHKMIIDNKLEIFMLKLKHNYFNNVKKFIESKK